jgi:2-amino-4-hydroxy-6-hydroxymethyldihydropteridine diphosphokinase
MNTIYLLLGSNMNDPEKQLNVAKKEINGQLGPITRESKLYQTAAWGNTKQSDFLNQVIIVQSNMKAADCIETTMLIETNMGRVRTEKNAPRLIDIDILYFNKDIIHTQNLIVPHPEIENRRFVLTPLNELSPKFIHPILKKNNHELLLDCKDTLDVKKI